MPTVGPGVNDQGLPTFQWPDEYTTISNWFWDPISDNVNRMDDLIAGQLSTAPHRVSHVFGANPGDSSSGVPINFGTRDVPSEAAGWLNSLDSNILQWGDWILNDPRESLNTYFNQFNNGNPYFNVDSPDQDVSQTITMLQSALAREAITQKLTSIGIPEAGIQQALAGLFRESTSPLVQPGLDGPYFGNIGGPLSPPATGPLASLFAGAGLNVGGLGTFDPNQTAGSITNANLLAALQAAGITPGDLPVTPTPTGTSPVLPATFSSQEAALASNNGTGGVSPTALNPGAPVIYDWFGRHLKGFDTNGNPVFEDSATPGIFGELQKQQVADFLSPLPLSDAEKYGRTLLSQANLQPGLDRAMGTYDNTVLPGLTNLATTGGRTPTPDLYGQDQYDYVRNLMQKPLYGAQAKSLLNEFMTKGVPQATRDAAFSDFNLHGAQDIRSQYAGQTGSFSSDFLGALARGNADITNQLARESADYQFKGLGVSNMMDASQRDADTQSLGLLNEMTRGQGSVESALNEAAMQRQAQALPLLGSTSVARAQLPLTFGQDIINAGGANRLTDESLRPGGRNLSIFNSLLTGANPSNLGFVAQGQLPSATTSWLTGQAGNSAAFGNSGGGIWNQLGSSILGNPAFGNFAGGLLSKGLGALWDGITGLFGGGDDNSSAYTPGNYTGSDYSYNPSSYYS